MVTSPAIQPDRPPAEEDGSQRPIRVLHMGSPTGLYGAERWILALIKYLPVKSVESTVAVIRDDPDADVPALVRHASELGFETAIFEAPGRLSTAAIRQIRQFIEVNGINVLHTHGYKTDIIGRLAVRGTGCKTVSTPHGWSTESDVKLRVYEFLDRIAFASFDAVVPLSKDMYMGLRRWPWLRGNLSLINNGVDVGEIDAAVASADAAADEFVVGYIGRLVEQKRIDTLIEAFSRLDVARKRLIIVGEGPERSVLEALVKERGCDGVTDFLGYRKDRLALLKTFTVFALCSTKEGCPRCLMEAMAARVPVVATDVPGSRDLVEDNVTGLLFPYADSQAAADRLADLARDRSLRDALAGSARASIEKTYSADALAAAYMDLYRTLCGADRQTAIVQ